MQVGDDSAYPEGWGPEPLEEPPDLDYGLTKDETLMVELYDRPRKGASASEEEKERFSAELEAVRKEMFQLIKEKVEYQRDVNR